MPEPNKLLMLFGIILVILGSYAVMKEKVKTGVFIVILGYVILTHLITLPLLLHFKL